MDFGEVREVPTLTVHEIVSIPFETLAWQCMSNDPGTVLLGMVLTQSF